MAVGGGGGLSEWMKNPPGRTSEWWVVLRWLGTRNLCNWKNPTVTNNVAMQTWSEYTRSLNDVLLLRLWDVRDLLRVSRALHVVGRLPFSLDFLFAHVYSCLLMFTHVYSCLLMFTHVYSCLLMFTHVYSCTCLHVRTTLTWVHVVRDYLFTHVHVYYMF